MFKYIFPGIFALLFAICSTLPAQTVKIASPLRLLALGDSYTIGESVEASERWPNQLADSLRTRHVEVTRVDVIARTGWRTDELIKAIDKESPASDYDLVTLLIGVNNQYQERPVEQYVTEFAQLLDLAMAHAGHDPGKVVVLSIPDYAYTPFGKKSSRSNISREINRYNGIAASACAARNILFVNITPISRKGLENPAMVAVDDLHPSAIQYAQWVQTLLPYLEIP